MFFIKKYRGGKNRPVHCQQVVRRVFFTGACVAHAQQQHFHPSSTTFRRIFPVRISTRRRTTARAERAPSVMPRSTCADSVTRIPSSCSMAAERSTIPLPTAPAGTAPISIPSSRASPCSARNCCSTAARPPSGRTRWPAWQISSLGTTSAASISPWTTGCWRKLRTPRTPPSRHCGARETTIPALSSRSSSTRKT